ncbi:hypothetical protein [Bartonella sp. MM73XJBT]|nr:hypothetical protein [Bartonella sp. MM73XJBT]
MDGRSDGGAACVCGVAMRFGGQGVGGRERALERKWWGLLSVNV